MSILLLYYSLFTPFHTIGHQKDHSSRCPTERIGIELLEVLRCLGSRQYMPCVKLEFMDCFHVLSPLVRVFNWLIRCVVGIADAQDHVSVFATLANPRNYLVKLNFRTISNPSHENIMLIRRKKLPDCFRQFIRLDLETCLECL